MKFLFLSPNPLYFRLSFIPSKPCPIPILSRRPKSIISNLRVSSYPRIHKWRCYLFPGDDDDDDDMLPSSSFSSSSIALFSSLNKNDDTVWWIRKRRLVSTPPPLKNHPLSVVSFSSSSSSSQDTASILLTSDTKKMDQEEEEENHDNHKSIYKKFKELVKLIQYHDTLYYTPGLQPQISDEEYDALIRREEEILLTYPSFARLLRQDLDFIPSTQGIRWSSLSSSSAIHTYSQDIKKEKHSTNSTTITSTTTITARAHDDEVVSKSKIVGKRIHLLDAPMLSLENAMNPTQVIQWISRIQKKLSSSSSLYQEGEDDDGMKSLVLQIRAEPKLDGLSVSLRYEKQKNTNHYHPSSSSTTSLNTNDPIHGLYTLVWGATRGNGQMGEDVTDAVMAMTSSFHPKNHNTTWMENESSSFSSLGKIPYSFSLPSSFTLSSSACHPIPEIIEIRGEVILPTHMFHTLNQQQQQQQQSSSNDTYNHRTFSNARNAASGILLRYKDHPTMEEIQETQRLRSYLRFYAYGLEMSPMEEEKETSSVNHDGNNTTTTMTVLPKANKGKIKDIYSLLTDMGFTIPIPNKIITLTLHANQTITEEDCKELFQYHSSLSTLYSRSSSSSHTKDVNNNNNNINNPPELDIDGAVYKISDPVYCDLLGSSTRAPRWAIAHKYPPTCGVTQLLHVEVQVGRTGVLTPVAILSPVDIAGAVIRRATLHNFIQAQKILQPNPQGYIPPGTSVMICRAGDVIPQVIQRIHGVSSTTNTEEQEETTWISLIPPKTCPSCGSHVVFESSNPWNNVNPQENNEEDGDFDEAAGPVLRCGGSPFSCKPRAVSALTHAYSRSGFNIQGISEARIEQLVDATLIRYPVDVFRILDPNDSFTTTLSQLEGWGEKSTRKLAQQVTLVKKNGIALYQFIYSLGIRHVGLSSSKIIASTYGSVTTFFNALTEKIQLEKSLQSVHGLGPKTLSSLVSFSEDEELVHAARRLADSVPIKDDTTFSRNIVSPSIETEQPLPLQGLHVVFTGSLGISRTKAQELAVSVLGARSTSNTISKSTDLLVVGEKSGGKEKKAMDMNIKIMDGDEFLRLIEKLET